MSHALSSVLQSLSPKWHPVHWRARALRQEVEDLQLEETKPISKPSRRLWSNLNPETMKHEPRSVFGAAALVAGTTVGAGILALPAVTQVLMSDMMTGVRLGFFRILDLWHPVLHCVASGCFLS